jgi:cell division protein FtsL
VTQYDDRRDNVFLLLWTLAVLGTTAALLLYLGVRVRSIELGYELGRAQAELSKQREVERVLSLERAALETPERIDLVARTLLGMDDVSADRIIPAGPDLPRALEASEDGAEVARGGPGPATGEDGL